MALSELAFKVRVSGWKASRLPPHRAMTDLEQRGFRSALGLGWLALVKAMCRKLTRWCLKPGHKPRSTMTELV